MASRKASSFPLFSKRSLASSPASNLAPASFLGSSATSMVSIGQAVFNLYAGNPFV